MHLTTGAREKTRGSVAASPARPLARSPAAALAPLAPQRSAPNPRLTNPQPATRNPHTQQLTRGMEKTVAALVHELRLMSTEVRTDTDLANVAAISAGGNAEIGQLIADAMAKVREELGGEGIAVLLSLVAAAKKGGFPCLEPLAPNSPKRPPPHRRKNPRENATKRHPPTQQTGRPPGRRHHGGEQDGRGLALLRRGDAV